MYADYDSKISYVMFLHDYLLACEISRVWTLALREGIKETSRESQSSNVMS